MSRESSQIARTGPSAREDDFLRLQQENASLKKMNLEEREQVKRLGVQLTRIKNDWTSGQVPANLAPTKKARDRAEISKADRISELQMEISQREAREERLQQQVTLLKQQAGGGGSVASRPGVTRQRRPASARTAAPSRGALGQAAFAASPPSHGTVGEAGGKGGGDRMGSLLQMLQEKDRSLEEMRARMALMEKSHAEPNEAPIGTAPDSGDHGLPVTTIGVSEGAVSAELRRQLKKSAFDMSLLEQRYSHLDARFNTLRENHERVCDRSMPYLPLRIEGLASSLSPLSPLPSVCSLFWTRAS
jgi:hypothetical protein